MKEASGELNMTLITIVAIAAIAGLFAVLWPSIRNTIVNKWGDTENSANKITTCKKYENGQCTQWG